MSQTPSPGSLLDPSNAVNNPHTHLYPSTENIGQGCCNGGAQRVPGTNRIRCFDHGCNGREFSSLGNYHRHLKERNAISKKFSCPRCGRSFSRLTARNLHYEKRRCKSVYREGNRVQISLPLLPSNIANPSPIPPAAEKCYTMDTATVGSSFSASGPGLGSESVSSIDLSDPLALSNYDGSCNTLFDAEQERNAEHDALDTGVDIIGELGPYRLQNTDAASYNALQGATTSDAGPTYSFEHECDGQPFSSPENFLGQPKEQSGVASRFFCARCGRAFSRSTARDLHYEQRRCKLLDLQQPMYSQMEFNLDATASDENLGLWTGCSSMENHCSGCTCRSRNSIPACPVDPLL